MNLGEKLTGRTSYNQYYTRLKMVLERPAAKVSSLASLTIFTVVFFLSFAILPTFKTIASLKREITDAKTTEAKLQQKIQSLNQAETLYAQIAPNLEILNQVLPSDPEFERLAWQLNWLAISHQLTIVSGSFTEFPVTGAVEVKPNEANTIEVALSLKGSYPSLKAFIADLNQLDRLIAVEEAIITSKSVRTAEDALTTNLKLKAFYLPSL